MAKLNKENLLILNTIQFLARTKSACPEFVGESLCAEDADERSVAVFSASVVNGCIVVRANPARLIATIKAVAEVSGVALSERALHRVYEGVETEIAEEYGKFAHGWVDDLPGLLDGSTRLH